MCLLPVLQPAVVASAASVGSTLALPAHAQKDVQNNWCTFKRASMRWPMTWDV